MIRVLSRASRLARLQVGEVFGRLPGVDHELVAMDTFGDCHKELSLLDNQKADFFTDAIDDALINGLGDVAVHSAKDLPWPLRDGLDVIALTRSPDPAEALVSREGLILAELPPGARIGTSSPQRRANLLALRPDIEIVGIRGTIEERLSLIDTRTVDALVVASCALKRLGLEHRITDILPFSAHPLQGMLAVVARRDRPALRARFAPLDARLTYGKVWITGAGPGARELLTLKAADALAAADIIFHDDLVGRDCFNGCTAERVNVGKRKGNHTMPQESINELLYNEAVRGKRVVRLKGGDPFIFGRGGEEVRYLRERHVAVEVIPGITAAQAVAAESLVPLTERGIADSFTLVSAHGAPGTPARAKTVAVYMGASAKAGAAQRLTAEGFDTDAPVLLVRGASTAGASSTVVPLGKLQEDATPSPLCMVAGEGVRAYSAPRRILYTGIDPFACSFDGKVVHYPLISIEPADNLSSVDLDRYTGVIFTSRNAVRHFFRAAAPGSRELLAIGAATAAEIVRYGYRAAAVADPPDSDALVKLVDGRDHEGRWLYPCSQRSENVLHHHPRIDAVTIYRTVFVDQPTVDLTLFDAVVFSSPSTVESFFRMYTAIPSGCAVYVFGQVTSRKAIEHGISPEVIITALPGGNHE